MRGRRSVLLAAWVIVCAADSAWAQLVNDSIDAHSLAGNLLGDSARRSVLVYLPPGYETDLDRRYPVVYLLHSYGATNQSWLGESGYEGMDVTVVLDSLIGEGRIDPAIVVMPDASNTLGGSWYTDSPATGLWEQFVARDLVAFVDGKYRTRRDRHGRGIVGQSMGGYGALRIGIRHSEVFGAVLGMSAINLINPDPLGTVGHEAALSIRDGELDDVSPPGRVMWSKAAAFSPNRAAPPLYADLPVERTTAGIVRREAVWEKWRQNTLASQVSTNADRLQRLRIRLEVGTDDPLRSESVAFAGALADHGVPFSLVVFDGGHVAGVRRQFETSVFMFFDEYFNRLLD